MIQCLSALSFCIHDEQRWGVYNSPMSALHSEVLGRIAAPSFRQKAPDTTIITITAAGYSSKRRRKSKMPEYAEGPYCLGV